MNDTHSQPVPAAGHPLQFDVDFPDRELNRISSAFRIFAVIPIAIVLATLGSTTVDTSTGQDYSGVVITGGGMLFLPPLLMLLFREKYPRWWFDWNREFLRFANRVYAYGLLLNDQYPSTDEHQYVRLE